MPVETSVGDDEELYKIIENSKDADMVSITISLENLKINEQNLICDNCGAVYKKPWTLRNHIKKEHGKESTTSSNVLFVCDECKEVFLDHEQFSEHKKTHWICKTCGRTCDNNHALKRHMRSHRV